MSRQKAAKPSEEPDTEKLYSDFVELLEKEDKGECIRFAISALEKSKVDVVTLYSKLLAPSLNNMVCEFDEDTCIWKEHIRSSIIRAIIESSYPYILKQRDRNQKGKPSGRVLVVCPTEELHELGARMVADYFTLEGYEVAFVGANTPVRVIISAIQAFKPGILAMSVTNHYNLFAAKKVIEAIRQSGSGVLKIIVGGNAFRENSAAARDVGADLQVQTYEDIAALREGE